jgi:hypothetical protein
MSAHSRPASPRENGLVASPRYRLSKSVVPWITIEAPGAPVEVAESRLRHSPATNNGVGPVRPALAPGSCLVESFGAAWRPFG